MILYYIIQVSGNDLSNIYIDPKKGDRAMVIKNNDGDWAVMRGRWTGVKVGVKGLKGITSTNKIRNFN